jgi:hypothetical protein
VAEARRFTPETSERVDAYVPNLAVPSMVGGLHRWVNKHYIGCIGLSEGKCIPVDLIEKPCVTICIYGPLESKTLMAP